MDIALNNVPRTRRTRIVCISDTHNSTPKLPKGDVLIHAGDLTNTGSYSELSKAIQWLEKADFERKIVIAGNHDMTLDRNFYLAHGQRIHGQNPQDLEKCLALLEASTSITYLCHSSATIRLTDPKGPGTEFIVFGSPYSPRVGLWAFSYDREEGCPKNSAPQESSDSAPQASPSSGPAAGELWSSIPPNADIVITHTPPYGYCDASLGCEVLRKVISEVRPRLHICGHVHQARGAERVRWDTRGAIRPDYGPFELAVERWVDPNPDVTSAKISLVDLTARRGNRPLDFDGHVLLKRHHEPHQRASTEQESTSRETRTLLNSGAHDQLTARAGSDADLGGSEAANFPTTIGSGLQNRAVEPADRPNRRETCIVNCSIAANSYPHTGGKIFRKPIVVDLNLPVWR
ncbi:Metallo-dependent phosphatase-like protein [Cladorrhinum samala]|uniref:Metallo-dependent phosphatase-like protein n=1 Tax=Cladorrhinum samala TaxID=585594 RepID=A0AAV9H836_9PEZI|nr:Metallo-dependent phosphatase-like protein [Cladorrhinum samala]